MRFQLAVLLTFFLVGCGSSTPPDKSPATPALTVTGIEAAEISNTKYIECGTAGAKPDNPDTYVYTLLIKYPAYSGTTLPANPLTQKPWSINESDGLIEHGSPDSGELLYSQFSLPDHTLQINKTTVDLNKGSVVIVELSANGNATVLGQYALTAPFKDRPVEYVTSLAAKSKAVADFLQP